MQDTSQHQIAATMHCHAVEAVIATQQVESAHATAVHFGQIVPEVVHKQ